LTAIFFPAFVAPAEARNHLKESDYKIVGRAALNGGKTTDLFLRRDQEGRTFLYVASANRTLAIFDVTRSDEPHQVNRLVFTAKPASFQVRPVSADMALAATSNDPAGELTLLDLGNGHAVAVAKRFKNLDAYTIDGANDTAYVAQNGQLLVIHFNHPITRDAEIWEQSYEAR
jgi:hypothetical protein